MRRISLAAAVAAAFFVLVQPPASSQGKGDFPTPGGPPKDGPIVKLDCADLSVTSIGGTPLPGGATFLSINVCGAKPGGIALGVVGPPGEQMLPIGGGKIPIGVGMPSAMVALGAAQPDGSVQVVVPLPNGSAVENPHIQVIVIEVTPGPEFCLSNVVDTISDSEGSGCP